ncbi:MAG: PEP-CTERM sorting domain-containing protein [Sedimentisphaerales bacterium]
MYKGVGKKMKILTASVVVALCASIAANASILYVSDLQLTNPGKFYSYASGAGSLSLSPGFSGIMKLEEEAVWNYSISGTISLSSALVGDISSGGYAKGLFATGRIVTITGTIKYIPTNTSIYTGTIISATMDEPDATWVLAESPSSAINGSAEFATNTTLGLGSGIAHGSDILKIGHFRIDFAFKSVSPNPSVFNTTQNLISSSNTLQITAIPEPATILLLSTAALALRIRKFKERNREK